MGLANRLILLRYMYLTLMPLACLGLQVTLSATVVLFLSLIVSPPSHSVQPVRGPGGGGAAG